VLSGWNPDSVIASPDLSGGGDPSSQASLMLHGLPRRSAPRNDGIQSTISLFHVIASPDLWGRGDPFSRASLMLHGLPRRSAPFHEHRLFCQYFTLSVRHVMWWNLAARDWAEAPELF